MDVDMEKTLIAPKRKMGEEVTENFVSITTVRTNSVCGYLSCSHSLLISSSLSAN